MFETAIDALHRCLAKANRQLIIAAKDYSPNAEESQALNLLALGADALVYSASIGVLRC